jgi:hypothetical protein
VPVPGGKTDKIKAGCANTPAQVHLKNLSMNIVAESGQTLLDKALDLLHERQGKGREPEMEPD